MWVKIFFFFAILFCRKEKTDLESISKPVLWYHQESNRGHKDFQSFALPTELWHQIIIACFVFDGAKLLLICQYTKSFLPFFAFFFVTD